jgi:hypothetical protein
MFSLCFVLFCFVLFCFVLFCFVLFCFALLCFALLCFALLCFALLCFALLCFALLCFACVFVYLLISVSTVFGYFFSPNNESQNVNMELVLDQKAYLEEINRSLRYVADNLRRRKTKIF